MKLSSVILLCLLFVLLICFLNNNNTIEGHSSDQCHDHITFTAPGLPQIPPMERIRDCTTIESENSIVHDLSLNIHISSTDDFNITFASRDTGAELRDNSSMRFYLNGVEDYLDGNSEGNIFIPPLPTLPTLSFNYNDEFREKRSYDELNPETKGKIEIIIDFMMEQAEIIYLERAATETGEDMLAAGSRLLSSTEDEMLNMTYEDIMSGNISNISNDLEKVLKDNFVLPYIQKSKRIMCDHLPGSIINTQCIPNDVKTISKHICNGSFDQTISFINENICNTAYSDFKGKMINMIQKLENDLEEYIQKIEDLFNLIKDKVIINRDFNQDLDQLGTPEIINIFNQTLRYYGQLQETVNAIEFFDGGSIPPEDQESINDLISGINSTFSEVTDRFDNIFPDGSDSLKVKDIINDMIDKIDGSEYSSLINEEYENINIMIQGIHNLTRSIKELIESINVLSNLLDSKLCQGDNREIRAFKTSTCGKVDQVIDKLNYECCNKISTSIRENCNTPNIPTCPQIGQGSITTPLDDPFVTSFLPDGDIYNSVSNSMNQISSFSEELNQVFP